MRRIILGVGQGLLVSILGCIVGLALAAALSRMLAGMLYGVSAADTLTMAGVIIIVLAVLIQKAADLEGRTMTDFVAHSATIRKAFA